MDEPQRMELTDDLLDFAKRSAVKEAKKYCPRFVQYDDVIHVVLLELLRKPPKYDPSKGASKKTLIYTVVHRTVLEYAERQKEHAEQFGQIAYSESEAGRGAPSWEAIERLPGRMKEKPSLDDILDYIHDEQSRELCRIVVECKGNMSKAARQLGLSEGAVRYRLKQLAPKMLRAGFNLSSFL